MENQDLKIEFEKIKEIIRNDSCNYLGYKRLGDYYLKFNVNQAFLCYEQAFELCKDIEIKKELEKSMEVCKKSENYRVNPVSFVILSYNSKEIMIECLESIKAGCVPGSYEIVVVDNNSTDGIRDYLVNQKDIKLVLNDHNTSFAEGCNQGAKFADNKNDILLLNNDTVVPPFAVFYMRLSLYENDEIGSVGPLTNAALSFQLAQGNYSSKEQWLQNAKEIHLPCMYPNENRAWLVGFALLIKRKAWDFVGNLDERFRRGLFEDTDYGFRLSMSGYKNVVCHNAFIYHYGSVSMKRDIVAYNKSLIENEKKLNDKLGMEFNRYMLCHNGMIAYIKTTLNEELSVLEIGCGFGHALSKIKYLYPDSYVVGIESNKSVAKIAKNIANVICIDVEKEILPFPRQSFNYILLTNVVNQFDDPVRTISLLKEYLKEDGRFIILTPNLMKATVLGKILKGQFESIDEISNGSKHFYTRREIIDVLNEAGVKPCSLLKMNAECLDIQPAERALLNAIKSLPGVVVGEDLEILSYIFTASLK